MTEYAEGSLQLRKGLVTLASGEGGHAVLPDQIGRVADGCPALPGDCGNRVSGVSSLNSPGVSAPGAFFRQRFSAAEDALIWSMRGEDETFDAICMEIETRRAFSEKQRRNRTRGWARYYRDQLRRERSA